MCGIYGFIPKAGRSPDLDKLTALGLYNIQRGVDNCGYYYGGNIEKGVGPLANFGRFIVENDFVPGDLPPLFMGHNRKTTRGENNWINAHPHQIGDDTNGYVQTHNGTINNIQVLTRVFGVDAKDIKVDSIALAKIIYERGFEVLNHYEGFAALSMIFLNEPNTMYLFHGKSREFKSDKHPKEERPLFIYHADEGIYYSSIKESLDFICGNVDEPYELPHNIIYKCYDGMELQIVQEVERENANCTYFDRKYETHRWNPEAGEWVERPKPRIEEKGLKPLKQIGFEFGLQNKVDAGSATNTDGGSPFFSSVMRETMPKEGGYINSVYFWQGRYFRCQNILMNGEYRITPAGTIVEKDYIGHAFYYQFFRGALIKNRAMYDKLLELYPNMMERKELNIPFYLSQFAEYPVTCLHDEGATCEIDLRRVWWSDGRKFDGRFAPKWSKRSYTIKSGKLDSISKAENDEVVFNDLQDTKLVEFLIDNIKFDKPNRKEHKIEVSTNQTEEEIRTEIASMVSSWCKHKIFRAGITRLPEQFIMFIDWVILQVIQEEYSVVSEVSDAELERHTTALLKTLIKNHVSFEDHINKHAYSKFICSANIEACFSTYDINEIIEFTNRYELIDFNEDSAAQTVLPCSISVPLDMPSCNSCDTTEDNDPTPVNEDLDITKGASISSADMARYASMFDAKEAETQFNKLIAQWMEVEKIADECQALEYSEFAQQVANISYTKLNEIKKGLLTIALENNKDNLIPVINQIKC